MLGSKICEYEGIGSTYLLVLTFSKLKSGSAASPQQVLCAALLRSLHSYSTSSHTHWINVNVGSGYAQKHGNHQCIGEGVLNEEPSAQTPERSGAERAHEEGEVAD